MTTSISAKKYRFNGFTKSLTSGLHNFNSDAFKWMLTNSSPLSSMSAVADVEEVAAGNGYVAGGVAATLLAHYEQEGASVVAFKDFLIKATGGDIGPFRYIVLANTTADDLCWFYDLEQAVTIVDGSSMSLDLKGVSLTVSVDADAI